MKSRAKTKYLSTRVFVAAALLLLFAAVLYLIYRFIYIPYRETTKIMHLFAANTPRRNKD